MTAIIIVSFHWHPPPYCFHWCILYYYDLVFPSSTSSVFWIITNIFLITAAATKNDSSRRLWDSVKNKEIFYQALVLTVNLGFRINFFLVVLGRRLIRRLDSSRTYVHL